MDTRLDDIWDTIASTLKKNGFGQMFLQQPPKGIGVRRFVVLQVPTDRQVTTQARNPIVQIMIHVYEATIDDDSQPIIRKQLRSILSDNQKNLHRLFQHTATRVNLPHSAEMWFEGEAINDFQELDKQQYAVRSVPGFITVSESTIV